MMIDAVVSRIDTKRENTFSELSAFFFFNELVFFVSIQPTVPPSV